MNRTDPQRTPLLGGGPTSRRDLFRIGGLTLAAGALVVACGSDEPVARTGGTLAPEPNQFEPTESPAALVRTLSSLEQLMAVTYQQVLDEGWLQEASLTEAFTLMRDHHEGHVGELATVTRDLGGEPYEEPNAYLQATIVDPGVLSITNALATDEPGSADEARTALLDLAYSLENMTLQTYVRSTPRLPSPEVRQQVMALGGGLGRHIAVILTAQEQPLPFAIVPIGAAAPADATIDESGPVATPPTTAAPAPAEE